MATGAPGTNGVWQYGEDDSEATFSALLNKAASTTDTQIGADRTRLTAVEGRATALEARKLSGLVPIVPGGVTFVGGTGSVNALGQITFNNCTGVLVNNCFSAEYKNYRIVFEGYKGATTGNHTVIMRMASGGSTNTANSYETGAIGWQVNDGAGQQLGGGASTFFYFNRAYTGGANFNTSIDVITPFTTQYTRVTGTAFGRTDGQGQNIILNGMHWVGSSFDGIGLEITGSNFNGTFSIYGYND